MTDITDAYEIHAPIAAAIPLVVDSPHSWRTPPPDFGTSADEEDLLTSWDAWVDEMFSAAPIVGGTLLAARFPRFYLDANRARDDIDPELLASPWPEPLNPSAKSAAGMGVIRRLALPDRPVYDRLLPVSEVQHRLATYYDPYHNALSGLINAAHERFGKVLHLDCHSMKSVGNAMNDDAGRPRPDIVVSDRNNTTADPELTRAIGDLFGQRGYAVGINDPYKGAELISLYSDPLKDRHSIQIELNRRLYMDEKNFTKNPEPFRQLQSDINGVLSDLANAL